MHRNLCRLALPALLILVAVNPAPAYIAVAANRLTLSEVMLEFPHIVVLQLQQWDVERGAYLFDVEEVLQGSKPSQPMRLGLLDGGKVPKRLSGLGKGSRVVAFLGSPDNRSLLLSDGGWFLTQPNQGWERFSQFRDDFPALFAGSPRELADAIRTLRRGGPVIVPIQPREVGDKERIHIRYEADFPHRRWPTLPAGAVPRAENEFRMALASRSPAARQQATIELGERISSEVEADLRKGLGDPAADVRQAAILGLSRQKTLSRESIQALTQRVTDEDRFVCAMAAWCLGRAGAAAHGSVPDLEKALEDRDYNHDFRPHRAAEAAEAILALAPNTDAARKAVRFFLADRMLTDHRVDSEGTRTAAARALGRSGPSAREALPVLVKTLKDSLPATRIAAAEAIVLIGGTAEQRAAALAVLKAEIAAGDVAARIQALRAAGAIRAGELRAVLQTVSEEADPDLKREARQALARLAP